jgi:hypothetical protein
MKNLLLATGLFLLGNLALAPLAVAYGPRPSFGYPLGFYPDYGIHYSYSLRKPPHFAAYPPVYYGSRMARTYRAGLFVSPPLVTVPAGNYFAPLAAEFVRPPAIALGLAIDNPYYLGTAVTEEPSGRPEDGQLGHNLTHANSLVLSGSLPGPIRLNPFVRVDADR